jgi:hypothetical protein
MCCKKNPNNINDTQKLVFSENSVFNLLISMPEYAALVPLIYMTDPKHTAPLSLYSMELLEELTHYSTPSRYNTDILENHKH